MLHLILSPKFWGLIVMAIGLKIIGIGIEMKRGRWVSAEIKGHIKKTRDDGTEVYTPVVSFYLDGEEITAPLHGTDEEIQYEEGRVIDAVYLQKRGKLYQADNYPYIRIGIAAFAFGIVLFFGIALLSRMISDNIGIKIPLKVTAFIAGTALTANGLFILIKRIFILKKGKRLQAKVLGYEVEDKIYYRPVLAFEYNGKKMAMPADRKDSSRDFEVGKMLSIAYLEDKPQVYIADLYDIREIVLCALVAVIAFIFAALQ